MRFRIQSLLAIHLLGASPVAADWLDLKDGTSLRGVDFKELPSQGKKKRCAFTLEDGKSVALDWELVSGVRKSPSGETVEHNGQQVSLREKVRRLREESAKRQKDALRDIERWAAGGAEAGSAQKRLGELPDLERERALATVLTDGKSVAARKLAARELTHHKSKSAVACLAWSTVSDEQASVRDSSLESLTALKEPTTSDYFLPYLKSPSSEQRTRAASALEKFPSEGSVPVLIETAKLIGTDYGRGFFFRGEERAYVGDHHLVSGGTGFAIVEVADPEIRSVRTGVVLDAKVRKVEVELETRVRALRTITGQDFGDDLVKWRDWWRSEHPGSSGATK